jgi:hypothetical protein
MKRLVGAVVAAAALLAVAPPVWVPAYLPRSATLSPSVISSSRGCCRSGMPVKKESVKSFKALRSMGGSLLASRP